MMELVGAKLLDWGIGKAADVIFDQTGTQVKARLNKSDLQEAIALGVHAAETFLPDTDGLFFYCDDREKQIFKQAVFSDSAVQEELQRPFHNQGKPRLEFLIAGFHQVEQDTKIRLNDRALKSWLEKFCDAYCEKTVGIRFQIAREDYCEQLVKRYDKVEFLGIDDIDPNEESKDLDDIFVMPYAVGERRGDRSIASLSNARPRIFMSYGSSATDISEELEEQLQKEMASAFAEERQRQLLQEQRQQVRAFENQWSGEKVLASKLLQKTDVRKLVLLGAPGSGKTTLMCYFAVMLAKGTPEKLGLDSTRESRTDSASQPPELLPILIRIRDLALKPDLGILAYAKQFAEESMSCMPLPEGFFEDWLERGQALILLDGLDEVAEEGQRQEMVRKIETFLAQYDQNLAIITSRPAGYRRDFFRTSEYPHYLLQPFDDDQIDQFISSWYTRRSLDSQEAERCKTSLKKALNDKDRIKQLAKNPLLLTIIALIHRYQAELPRDRYELYHRAVNTLIRTWDKKREITSHQALQYLKLDDLRRIMERLAYWIHTQGGTGDAEGGTLIDRDELIDQLTLYISEEKKVKRHEAKEEAIRFLKHIQERTGLLNEQGQERYAFVHKTFQEYLTAQEILEQQWDDRDVVLNYINRHLHDPHWREVLLLLIAQQKKSPLNQCLRAILNFPDPYGKWLHRNLFFAGDCLAENIPVTDETLSDKILDDLVALEIQDEQPWVIRQQTFRTLCSLYETQFDRPALDRLRKAPIDKVGEVRLQEYRAALGDEEGAIVSLLALLKDSESDARYSAAEALGNLGNASELVIDALLALLDDLNENVFLSAVEVLGKLGNASERVVDKLLALLNASYFPVRSSAAAALGKLDNTSEQVVDKLLALLNNSDFSMRPGAAEALGKLGNTSERVINTLLALLIDSDSNVRFKAAEALGKLGNASKRVINGLLALLNDTDLYVQFSAAEALSELGSTSEQVVDKLLALLKSSDPELCFRAAAGLGNLGNTSERVIDTLLALLNDSDLFIRSSAATTLGNLGNGSEEVVDALLTLLNDLDFSVRSSAAEALGNLGNSSERVTNGLLALLNDWEPDVRSRAANALGKSGNASKRVIDALLALLSDSDLFVRSRAALALGKLGKAQNGVTAELVQLLEQNSEGVGLSDAVTGLWSLIVGEG